jgi:hypothetical protein
VRGFENVSAQFSHGTKLSRSGAAGKAGKGCHISLLDTSLVSHEVRVVVKNITMTIKDSLLEEVRVAAAREGISMSRYLAKTVERALEQDHRYAAARKRFLSRQPVALRKKGRKLPSRDALHERESLC